MESVGDFEYSSKDLIGHGAFAVVFKGRHKTKHDLIVAVKSITKKNLAKSQSLLGKEIKILKELTELHHENVVALLDCKETPHHVFLVMEYCNGGDLADYLHVKGTLSEDTIRLFLRQIAGAMQALNAKGIVHRDLKPQNILLCHSAKANTPPCDITLKIADFGFARFLQDGVMAATLCGSPMYMAPEVIMSLQYDAKADLWSIGTIVFQCLTGKAPFQAQTPQALKQFYEKNVNLIPKIPSGTSPDMMDLLLRLLKRTAKDRMEFDEFFNHPFLKTATKFSSPVPVPSRRSISPDAPSPLSTPPVSSPLSGSILPSPPGWCREGGKEELAQDLGVDTATHTKVSPLSQETSTPSSLEDQDFVIVPANIPMPEDHTSDDVIRGTAQEKWPTTEVLSSPPRVNLPQNSPTGSPRPTFLPVTAAPPSPSPVLAAPVRWTEPIPVPTQKMAYEQIQRSLGENSGSLSSSQGDRGAAAETSPISPSSSPKLPIFRSDPIDVRRDSVSSQSSDAGGGRTGIADISSLSPPSVQFVIGTPPGGGRRRSLSGGTPPPSLSGRQTPTSLRPAITSSQSTNLSGSPLRRSLLSTMSHGVNHPAFGNCNVLSPILGSPTKDPSKTDPWNIRCKTEPSLTTMVGLDQYRNINNSPPSLRMAFGGRAMTLPEISSRDFWPGMGCIQESTEQAECCIHRSGSGNRLCDQGTCRMSHMPGASPASQSPPGAVMVPYSHHACHHHHHIPYWMGALRDSQCSSARVRHNSAGACGGYFSDSSPPGAACFPCGISPSSLEDPIMFVAPDLPEETILEREHNETLAKLNFVLALVECILDLAKTRATPIGALTESFMRRESNAEQFSMTSEGYRRAEQLVLYMRALQLLSSSLQLSQQEVQAGRLRPSTNVRSVLNAIKERFHYCLNKCKALNMPGILDAAGVDPAASNITADKLLYNYAIDMCQTAALDELFGNSREQCFRRYQTAQILLHSLAQQIGNDEDKKLLEKYKAAVEKRLFLLQKQAYVNAYDTT